MYPRLLIPLAALVVDVLHRLRYVALFTLVAVLLYVTAALAPINATPLVGDAPTILQPVQQRGPICGPYEAFDKIGREKYGQYPRIRLVAGKNQFEIRTNKETSTWAVFRVVGDAACLMAQGEGVLVMPKVEDERQPGDEDS